MVLALWPQEWRPIEVVRQAIDDEDGDRETDGNEQELEGGLGTKLVRVIPGLPKHPGRGSAQQEYYCRYRQRGDDCCHGLPFRRYYACPRVV